MVSGSFWGLLLRDPREMVCVLLWFPLNRPNRGALKPETSPLGCVLFFVFFWGLFGQATRHQAFLGGSPVLTCSLAQHCSWHSK